MTPIAHNADGQTGVVPPYSLYALCLCIRRESVTDTRMVYDL